MNKEKNTPIRLVTAEEKRANVLVVTENKYQKQKDAIAKAIYEAPVEDGSVYVYIEGDLNPLLWSELRNIGYHWHLRRVRKDSEGYFTERIKSGQRIEHIRHEVSKESVEHVEGERINELEVLWSKKGSQVSPLVIDLKNGKKATIKDGHRWVDDQGASWTFLGYMPQVDKGQIWGELETLDENGKVKTLWVSKEFCPEAVREDSPLFFPKLEKVFDSVTHFLSIVGAVQWLAPDLGYALLLKKNVVMVRERIAEIKTEYNGLPLTGQKGDKGQILIELLGVAQANLRNLEKDISEFESKKQKL